MWKHIHSVAPDGKKADVDRLYSRSVNLAIVLLVNFCLMRNVQFKKFCVASLFRFWSTCVFFWFSLLLKYSNMPMILYITELLLIIQDFKKFCDNLSRIWYCFARLSRESSVSRSPFQSGDVRPNSESLSKIVSVRYPNDNPGRICACNHSLLFFLLFIKEQCVFFSRKDHG